MNEKLRIGLLINEPMIPAWAFKMLEIIQESDHSEIVLIVRRNAPVQKRKSKIRRVWEQRDKILFTIFKKIDKRLFRNKPDAFKMKDLTTIVNCPELTANVRVTKFSDTVFEDDVQEIKKHNIDVFIRLGFRILRGDILKSAKFGIWSFHHGDNKVNRGGPAGHWEVINQWDETGVILQILTEDLDGGQILARSYSSTDTISFGRNRNNFYWKSLSLLPRKLKELHAVGEKEFFSRLAQENHPYFYYNELFVTPSNWTTFKAFSRMYIQKVLKRLSGFFYFEQWILLYRIEKQPTFSTSFYRFKRIMPPRDRFWADPFVVERNDKYYIFLEELVYGSKGNIAVMEMDQKGNYSKPQVVIEEDHHLSYPFLYEEAGELYMIPESAQNHTIDLYKCVEFPNKWEHCVTLMENIYAVDATIYKKDDKYWMFCNVKENEGASTHDELFLFYSDKLISQNWSPHPMNPIVSDVKNARPAGNIISINNRLYRPSQNCGKHYGYGMQINEILEMNEEVYREQTIQSIHPNWDRDLLSTHTLNNCGRLTVIDAKIKRRKF